jgi:hypothetical protein
MFPKHYSINVLARFENHLYARERGDNRERDPLEGQTYFGANEDGKGVKLSTGRQNEP